MKEIITKEDIIEKVKEIGLFKGYDLNNPED